MRLLKKPIVKYSNKLTNEQIKELLLIYYPSDNIVNIDIEKQDDSILIEITIKIINNNGEECNITDLIIFKDYRVEIYDFYDCNAYEHLKQYRKKMLEYFGEQYAVDFLLGE